MFSYTMYTLCTPISKVYMAGKCWYTLLYTVLCTPITPFIYKSIYIGYMHYYGAMCVYSARKAPIRKVVAGVYMVYIKPDFYLYKSYGYRCVHLLA